MNSFTKFRDGAIDAIKSTNMFDNIYILNNINQDILSYSLNNTNDNKPTLFVMFNSGEVSSSGNNNARLKLTIDVIFVIVGDNQSSQDEDSLNTTNDIMVNNYFELSSFIINDKRFTNLSYFKPNLGTYSFMNNKELVDNNKSALMFNCSSTIHFV